MAQDILKDPAAAEDLAQDAVEARLRRGPGVSSETGWFVGVARRLSLQTLRTRRRRSHRESMQRPAGQPPTPAEVAEKLEAHHAVSEAMLRLPEISRAAIVLRYYDDLPIAQVAHRLGIHPKAAESRIYRGLKELQHALRAKFGGNWAAVLLPLSQPSLSVAGIVPPLIAMNTASKTVLAAAAVLLALGIPLLLPDLWEDAEATSSETADVMTPPAVSSLPDAAVLEFDGESSLSRTLDVPAQLAQSSIQAVRVIEAHSGAPVPGATVLSTAPGFNWGALDDAGKEAFSLDTEVFLREHGVTTLSDDEGLLELPVAAVTGVVVGRKGLLYGAGLQRQGEVWTLSLEAVFDLVVEVVDSRGASVAGVKIHGRSQATQYFPMHVPRLGTTDADGLMRHSFVVPEATVFEELLAPDGLPETWSIYAELAGRKHGTFTLDLHDPPPGPVRIILPPTGTVEVTILNPVGNRLDIPHLADSNLRIEAVGPIAPSDREGEQWVTTNAYVGIDADGIARIPNLTLGLRWRLHSPTLLSAPLEFDGPRTGQLDVFVEHRMHADHLAVSSKLVDPDGMPMADTRFSIVCSSGGKHLGLAGGLSDEDGWFRAYLPTGVLGASDVDLHFGMDWVGAAPTREVVQHLAGPLRGPFQIDDVVMPAAIE